MKTNTGLHIRTFTRALQAYGRLDLRLMWAAWDAEMDIRLQELQ